MTHIIATEKVIEILEEIKKTKEWIKLAEKEEEKLKQQLYNIMNEHEEVITEDGELLATWKYAADSVVFDAKAYKNDYPEEYEEYCVNRPGARRLVLK